VRALRRRGARGRARVVCAGWRHGRGCCRSPAPLTSAGRRTAGRAAGVLASVCDHCS
jgi:hypothetical protein